MSVQEMLLKDTDYFFMLKPYQKELKAHKYYLCYSPEALLLPSLIPSVTYLNQAVCA